VCEAEPPKACRALERAPVGKWTKTWVATLVGVVLLLVGWELTCRFGGFEPSFQSDARLWAMTRQRVSNGDRNSIVLVGSSRVLLNLDLDTVEEATGRAAVQLGVNGCTPLPFIAELASDESFSGLVLCGVAPAFFFDQCALHSRRFSEFYAAYQEFDVLPAQRFDHVLLTAAQENFAFRHPALAPSRLLAAARAGAWPVVPWVRVRGDRDQFGDFEHAAPAYFVLQEQFYEKQKQPAAPNELASALTVIELSVERIRSRGGEVVFVRFPTQGKVVASESRPFPRAEYWDQLAANTKGVTLHADDYPSLKSFRFPDGSHLDYRDAPRFTRELLRIVTAELAARGDQRLAARVP
jgi:hypothetical protein